MLATLVAAAGCRQPISARNPGPAAPERHEGVASERIENRAAIDLDCPRRQIEVEALDEGVAQNYVARGCGRRAVYAVLCSLYGECDIRLDSPVASAAPAAPAPAPAEAAEPPTGLAGFTFGMTQQEAEEACEGAGHSYERNAGRAHKARCSGTAEDPGFASAAELRFCDGALCRVRLRDVEDLKARIADLRGALEQRYGKPAKARVGVEAGCEETKPGACLDVDYEWGFPSGHRIRLHVDRRRSPVAVRLEYQAPREAPGDRAL